MIDIQSELLHLKQQRQQEYISISELLDFLKEHNPKSSYGEIARYLLIKLSPHDIRNSDEPIWGNEEFAEWHEQHGIDVFDVPLEIDKKETYLPPNLFFDTLEYVRDNSLPNCLMFDDVEQPEHESSVDYLPREQSDIYVKRERIESILSINTMRSTIESKINESSLNTVDDRDLTIKQLIAENNKLKAEIAELKGQSSPKIINYNNSSIYGHSSENLELVFRLSKVIAEKCDIDNPHSYPTKKDFEDYIKKYYSDSLKLCEAFYQILIPNKVKNRGRTPKGVDTFKGFI